jgi:hypothetical protein
MRVASFATWSSMAATRERARADPLSAHAPLAETVAAMFEPREPLMFVGVSNAGANVVYFYGRLPSEISTRRVLSGGSIRAI